MLIDMTNKEVGQLIVTERVNSDKHGFSQWRCLCKCGKEITVRGQNLRRGVKSCGCLTRNNQRQFNKTTNWQGFEEIGKTFFKNILFCAKSRNLEVTITIEDIWNAYVTQNKCCNLSGLPISFRKPITASVDRIDSKLGYIIGNIQLVHKDINKLKTDFPQDKFISLCHKVSKFSYPDVEVSDG